MVIAVLRASPHSTAATRRRSCIVGEQCRGFAGRNPTRPRRPRRSASTALVPDGCHPPVTHDLGAAVAVDVLAGRERRAQLDSARRSPLRPRGARRPRATRPARACPWAGSSRRSAGRCTTSTSSVPPAPVARDDAARGLTTWSAHSQRAQPLARARVATPSGTRRARDRRALAFDLREHPERVRLGRACTRARSWRATRRRRPRRGARRARLARCAIAVGEAARGLAERGDARLGCVRGTAWRGCARRAALRRAGRRRACRPRARSFFQRPRTTGASASVRASRAAAANAGWHAAGAQRVAQLRVPRWSHRSRAGRRARPRGRRRGGAARCPAASASAGGGCAAWSRSRSRMHLDVAHRAELGAEPAQLAAQLGRPLARRGTARTCAGRSAAGGSRRGPGAPPRGRRPSTTPGFVLDEARRTTARSRRARRRRR